MPDRDQVAFCGQCGNLVQPEDQFCGSCGAMVLPPPPQAEQVIPEPASTTQAPTTQNTRTLFLAGVVSVLLLLVGGAVAYATMGPGLSLLGSSESPSVDESPPTKSSNEQGGATVKEQTTKERTSPSSKGKIVPKKPKDRPPETTKRKTPNPGTKASKAQAEQAAGDYYRAAGRQDFDYTYDHLDSTTKSGFTREEWRKKNEWFADNNAVIYHIESVELDESSQKPLAKVAVRLTGEDDSSSIRNTYFVYEDGQWKHRFTQEEKDLYKPDLSYEEFLKANQ